MLFVELPWKVNPAGRKFLNLFLKKKNILNFYRDFIDTYFIILNHETRRWEKN